MSTGIEHKIDRQSIVQIAQSIGGATGRIGFTEIKIHLLRLGGHAVNAERQLHRQARFVMVKIQSANLFNALHAVH